MKYIFILFFTGISYSQNLTFNEILSLYKMELGGVEEFLTSKKWEYHNGNSPDDESMGKACFAYNKNEYFPDRAESFINYYYSKSSNRKRVSVMIVNIDKYNKYLESIKSLGVKLVDSKVEDGEIIKIYRGKTTTIEVVVSTPKSNAQLSKNHYNIFIVDNEDYLENFSE